MLFWLVVVVLGTNTDPANIGSESSCPKWVNVLGEIDHLLEIARTSVELATPPLRAMEQEMEDVLANDPSDDLSGGITWADVSIPSKDLESLVVCEKNSTRCHSGNSAFSALMHAAHHKSRDFEELPTSHPNHHAEHHHFGRRAMGLGMHDNPASMRIPLRDLEREGLVLPGDVKMMNQSKWTVDESVKLGSGSYKTVYVGKLGQKTVAICKIPPPHNAEVFPHNELTYINFEIRYQMMFHRAKIGGKPLCSDMTPNIIGAHEIRNAKDEVTTIFLIRDLLDGDLEHAKYDSDPEEALSAATQMVAMLKCLKNAHVVHRDIKPANYLYRKLPNGHKRLFLQDFGLACSACDDSRITCDNEDTKNMKDMCGSGMYIPPEQFVQKPLYKFDMFSQGVTFKELNIDKINSETADLVTRMTNADFNERPDPQQTLEELFRIRKNILDAKTESVEAPTLTPEQLNKAQRVKTVLSGLETKLEELHTFRASVHSKHSKHATQGHLTGKAALEELSNCQIELSQHQVEDKLDRIKKLLHSLEIVK